MGAMLGVLDSSEPSFPQDVYMHWLILRGWFLKKRAMAVEVFHKVSFIRCLVVGMDGGELVSDWGNGGFDIGS